MTIPRDWLLYPITPAEVEADLAECGAPDFWLLGWRAILDRMAPGDELWEYKMTQYAATEEKSAGDILGFEQVLDGGVLRRRGLPEASERNDHSRAGFALVRGEEILDWIREPHP